MLLAAGCGRPAGPELAVVARITLPVDSAATLEVDRSGRFWIGAPGSMTLVGPAGAAEYRLVIPGDAPARALGEGDRRLYLAAGEHLAAVAADSPRLVAERDSAFTPIALVDVRGRYLFRAVGRGGVFGHDPETLEPLWGWAARGAPTTALAASPHGDVVYQALSGETGSVLLVRDLQTGRILWEEPLAAPVRELVAASNGDLVALAGEGDRAAVLRLRPFGSELMPVWRVPLQIDPAAAGIRYSPTTERLAVIATENGTGLRVLDAEAGALLGSVREPPLDAAFAPDGSLYLLYARELRRVALP